MLRLTTSLLLTLQLLPWGSGDPQPEGKDCRVNAFPTQAEFDTKAYQGHWYVVTMSRDWFELPFLSDWVPVTDLQIEHSLKEDGSIGINIGEKHIC